MPLLVQSATNTGSGSSISVTLGAGTTAGNCLAVAAGTENSTSRTISAVKLGGVADNFAAAKSQAQAGTEDTVCAIWTDQDCAGSQTAVAVTLSGSATTSAAAAEEWSGILTSGAVDKTNGTGTTTTSWSSGASGTLSQASEAVLGATYCATGAALTITGPGSPWTNLTQVGGASGGGLLAGYQVVSATTSLTYSGTQNGTSFESNASVIVTLEAASTNVTGTLGMAMAPMAMDLTGDETISGSAGLAMAPMALHLTGAETVSGSLGLAMAPMKLDATGSAASGVTGTLGLAMAAMAMRFSQRAPAAGGYVPDGDEAREFKRWLLWDL